MRTLKRLWRDTGPGLVVAATGLGAGDIVAAAVVGAEFGSMLLWAVAIGGLLKFCLNEGIGRWQLITGTTLLEGWITELPRFISWYFAAYLVFWSCMVAAAMMSATGLAAYGLWPALSVTQWGMLHALVAFAVVWTGAWRLLEGLMKGFIALMFGAILFCAALVLWQNPAVLGTLVRPSLPDDSLAAILSVMGGVGGSVTLLSYGYWIREEGWSGPERLRTMRWDLGVAYALTALFAMSVMLLGAGLQPEIVSGNGMALALAEQLVPVTGEAGKWVFLCGFWGATFSSMLGVWHGVPYIFANFVQHYRQRHAVAGSPASVLTTGSLTRSPAYRLWLAVMCFVPMLLLVLGRPVWIVVLYAVTGAFFMPLLALLLLYLNGLRRRMGAFCNSWRMQLALLACLLLFGVLLLQEI
ncbi:MAG: Nramp family divalent metal transporter [Pseudohongiellaceae bacterium]|jgi:Mn2+/Fe2+ NRAMP family transporter